MVQMKVPPQLNPQKPTNPGLGNLQPTPVIGQPVTQTMGGGQGFNPDKQATPTNTLQPAPMTTMSTTPQRSVNPTGSSLQPNPVTGQPVTAFNANSNPQAGWGVGYGNSNVGGGFSDFNNIPAVQNEINRMNQVMANRQSQGMGNGAQQDYLKMLQSYMQPYNQQQQNSDTARNDYNNSQAKADANHWANATISDIAAKYGFDYSRNYAKQQAEAEAQALRNANLDAQRRNEANRDSGKRNIDAGLMNMAEGLDRNYFQQMMAQQQNQVGTGMNAGIASDQDLRLQMSRQAEMGASYRDANLGKMNLDQNFNLDDLRLAEAMGLINQQSLAREDSLYNERLMQGYGVLSNDRDFYNNRDQQMWGRSQAEIDRAMNQQNTLVNQGLQQSQFDWSKYMDQQGLNQWQTQFDYGKTRDGVGDQQWQAQFDYSKVLGNHGMTMDERRLAEQIASRHASTAAAASRAKSSGGSGGSTPTKPTPQSNALAKAYEEMIAASKKGTGGGPVSTGANNHGRQLAARLGL